MTGASLGRATLAALACVGFVQWVASCKTAGPRGENASLPAPSTTPSTSATIPGTAPVAGASGCEAASDPVDCYLERAVLIEELLGDLYALEGSRDQRAVPAALEALDVDELDVQLLALSVLGPFADHEGVGAKVLPWLLADDSRREARAADVLARSKDPGLERLARQFAAGHGGEEAAPPLAGWWRDPQVHGISAYAGATRFPPGDSRRSIGLMTEDSVEKVLAFYGTGASTPALDVKAYQDKRNKLDRLASSKFEAALKAPEFLARQKRLDDLIKEYERTKDPKVLAKIARMDKEDPIHLPAPFDATGALLMPLPPLTGVAPMKDAKWLVLEERDGVPVRAIATYREPAVDRTVIVLGWSPTAYGGVPDRRTIRTR